MPRPIQQFYLLTHALRPLIGTKFMHNGFFPGITSIQVTHVHTDLNSPCKCQNSDMICISAKCFETLITEERHIVVVGWFEERSVEFSVEAYVS